MTKHSINEEIRANVVKVVGETPAPVEMELKKAIELAQQDGRDVICINTSGDVPVVKFEEYSKFMYELKKKQKQQKKKSMQSELKEVRISDGIAQHDLETKARNIDRILKDGDKVKMSIRYRGRQMRFIGDGHKHLEQLMGMLKSDIRIEQPIKIEGNTVSMIVATAARK